MQTSSDITRQARQCSAANANLVGAGTGYILDVLLAPARTAPEAAPPAPPGPPIVLPPPDPILPLPINQASFFVVLVTNNAWFIENYILKRTIGTGESAVVESINNATGGTASKGNISLNSLTLPASRAGIVSVLNTQLAGSQFYVNSMRLCASLDIDGRLVLQLAHIDGVSPAVPLANPFGLFLSDVRYDGWNTALQMYVSDRDVVGSASTTLGITSSPPEGVGGACLIIPAGQLSVTAPFAIPL